MKLKKGIHVRTQAEFSEFARAFNLAKPQWTLHEKQRYHNHVPLISLTHRPFKRFKIINRGIPSREFQRDRTFVWEYIYASKDICNKGDDEQVMNLLNFGFHITHKPPNEDRYTGFMLVTEVGREEEMKEFIEASNESTN